MAHPLDPIDRAAAAGQRAAAAVFARQVIPRIVPSHPAPNPFAAGSIPVRKASQGRPERSRLFGPGSPGVGGGLQPREEGLVGRNIRVASLLFHLLTVPALSGMAAPSGDQRVPAQLPQIETFMQIGAAARPALTKDGGTLFFTSSMTGTTQLYRLTEDGWPYQLTFFPNGISGYNLSHDERTIAATADVGGTERYQIYLLDAVSGLLRQVTDDGDARFGLPLFSLDDRKIYFSGNPDSPADFFIYEQDLSSGLRKAIFRREGLNGVGDMSDDGRFLLLYHSNSNTDNDLYSFEIATGKARHLTPHREGALHTYAFFANDPNRIYLLTDRNPDGINRPAMIDGEPPRMTFLFPEDRSPWPVETLTCSPDRKILAWTVNEDGWGRLHLWEIDEGRPLPVPELDGIVSSPSLADGGRIAFVFNSPLRTADIWTYRALGASSWGRRGGPDRLRQRTFSTYAGIDPAWFTPPRLIRYESFDGTEIPAFLYLPPGPRSGPIPFIIDVHGGPEGQFRPFFNRHFQYLLLHGYGILAPNVRGSSGYGRAYLDADNYKNRLDSVKDLAWGVKYLIREGLTTPDRVGVKGGSYGGYMTLAAMTEYPDLFAAGLDEVGIANFETFLAKTAAYRRGVRASEYGAPEDTLFLRSISPIHKVDRIRGALFVVHGENDPRVPVGEARQILGALKARGVPVDSLIFPDEGHGVSKLPNRLILYRRMVEFFDRYLKRDRK
jgi:dipeptidyl aminopeptidase/acylaminoacyl peptidase